MSAILLLERGTVGSAVSTDDGVTWTDTSAALIAANTSGQEAVAADSDGSIFGVAFKNGHWAVSPDGATWDYMSTSATVPLFTYRHPSWFKFARDMVYVPARLAPITGTNHWHRWFMCGYADTDILQPVSARKPTMGMCALRNTQSPMTGDSQWYPVDLGSTIEAMNVSFDSMAFDPINRRLWVFGTSYVNYSAVLFYCDALELSGGATNVTFVNATSLLHSKLRQSGAMQTFWGEERQARMQYDWASQSLRLIVANGSYLYEADGYSMRCGVAHNSAVFELIAAQRDLSLSRNYGVWDRTAQPHPGSAYTPVFGDALLNVGCVFTPYMDAGDIYDTNDYNEQHRLLRTNAGTWLYVGSDQAAAGAPRFARSSPGMRSTAISWSSAGLTGLGGSRLLLQMKPAAPSFAAGATMPMPACTTWFAHPPEFAGVVIDLPGIQTYWTAVMDAEFIHGGSLSTAVALASPVQDVAQIVATLTAAFNTTGGIDFAELYLLREVLTFATTHTHLLTGKSLLTSTVDTDGALGVRWDHDVTASAAFAAELSSAYGKLMQSIAVLASPTSSQLAAGGALTSAMVFVDELARYWVDTLSSSTAVTGAATSVHRHVAALVDAMVASDSGLTRLTATGVLADAMATLTLLQVAPLELLTSSAALSTMIAGLWQSGGILADAVALANATGEWWGPSALLTDSVGAADAATNLATAYNAVISTLIAADAAVLGIRIVAVCADSVEIGTTPASVLTALEQPTDELHVYTAFRIGDESYRGYVLNAANKAASEYTAFDFNSLAVLGTETFVANGDGLFKLGGNTDAGEPIEATIRTGLMAIADGKMAQVVSAYVGYASDNTIVLKAIVTSRTGDKHEYWYQLTEQTADVTREGRIKLGRGLKSVYWQFELTNVDGGTLDLSNIKFHRIALDRRI